MKFQLFHLPNLYRSLDIKCTQQWAQGTFQFFEKQFLRLKVPWVEMWLQTNSEEIQELLIVCLFPSRTKIFIRHPRTLFATEDAFQVCKHKLGEMLLCKFNCNATLSITTLQRVKLCNCVTVTVAATRIQAKYKGYRVKGDYQKQKEAGECYSAHGYVI